MNDFWQKQSKEKPLFPDQMWSRPENKHSRGKLLIVGGNSHGFAVPALAYSESEKAGIGTARVILPADVKKLVGNAFEDAIFAPSTPSGSFSQAAIADLLEQASWADGVLLAGDFGHNSETAILLENFAKQYSGQMTLTHDAVDYFQSDPRQILERPETTIVLTFAQLQKVASSAGYKTPFTFSMMLPQLVEALHDFSEVCSSSIITMQHDQIFVAHDGAVSSTPVVSTDGATTGQAKHDVDIWRVKLAAHAAVWWLQNPSKTFEALTSAVLIKEK